MVNGVLDLRRGLDTLNLYLGRCAIDWYAVHTCVSDALPEHVVKYKGLELIRRKERRRHDDVCFKIGHFRFFVNPSSALVNVGSLGFVCSEPSFLIKWLCHILDVMSADEKTGEIKFIEWPFWLRMTKADLHCDFVYNGDFDMKRFRTRLKSSGFFQDGRAADGKSYYWGSSKIFQVCLYAKHIEIERRGKQYMKGVWQEKGYDGVSKVWRLEGRFRVPKLNEIFVDRNLGRLGVRSIDFLWSYLIREFEYCERGSDSGHLYRIPLDPLWQKLREAFPFDYPELHKKKYNRASLEWLRRRYRKGIMKYCAEYGYLFDDLPDFVKEHFAVTRDDYERVRNTLEFRDDLFGWDPAHFGLDDEAKVRVKKEFEDIPLQVKLPLEELLKKERSDDNE